MIRFADYADTYARDVIALRRGARRELEMLKPLRRRFDRELLSAIDADRVRAYMAARTGEGVGPRTVNREIDVLKGMLRDAVRKYLTASPIVGLKRLKAPPIKRRLLQPAEEHKLLEVCEDAQDRAIIILGIDTMIRLGDLLDLERSEHDGQWLYVKHAKSGEAYETALSARALAVLNGDRADGRAVLLREVPTRPEPAGLGRARCASASSISASKAGLRLRPQARRADVPLGDAAHGRDAVPAREGRADQRGAETRQLETPGDAAPDLCGGPTRRSARDGRRAAAQKEGVMFSDTDRATLERWVRMLPESPNRTQGMLEAAILAALAEIDSLYAELRTDLAARNQFGRCGHHGSRHRRPGHRP